MSALRVLTLPFASQQAVRAAAMGFALFAGGCASQHSSAQTGSHAGMTAQAAPVQREPSDTAVEDASEPWSPHYGWLPRTREFSPSYAPIPVERVSTTPNYTTMDPDAVIRHAVAAHEMRRQ
jgi:hypothetical protein